MIDLIIADIKRNIAYLGKAGCNYEKIKSYTTKFYESAGISAEIDDGLVLYIIKILLCEKDLRARLVDQQVIVDCGGNCLASISKILKCEPNLIFEAIKLSERQDRLVFHSRRSYRKQVLLGSNVEYETVRGKRWEALEIIAQFGDRGTDQVTARKLAQAQPQSFPGTIDALDSLGLITKFPVITGSSRTSWVMISKYQDEDLKNIQLEKRMPINSLEIKDKILEILQSITPNGITFHELKNRAGLNPTQVNSIKVRRRMQHAFHEAYQALEREERIIRFIKSVNGRNSDDTKKICFALYLGSNLDLKIKEEEPEEPMTPWVLNRQLMKFLSSIKFQRNVPIEQQVYNFIEQSGDFGLTTTSINKTMTGNEREGFAKVVYRILDSALEKNARKAPKEFWNRSIWSYKGKNRKVSEVIHLTRSAYVRSVVPQLANELEFKDPNFDPDRIGKWRIVTKEEVLDCGKDLNIYYSKISEKKKDGRGRPSKNKKKLDSNLDTDFPSKIDDQNVHDEYSEDDTNNDEIMRNTRKKVRLDNANMFQFEEANKGNDVGEKNFRINDSLIETLSENTNSHAINENDEATFKKEELKSENLTRSAINLGAMKRQNLTLEYLQKHNGVFLADKHFRREMFKKLYRDLGPTKFTADNMIDVRTMRRTLESLRIQKKIKILHVVNRLTMTGHIVISPDVNIDDERVKELEHQVRKKLDIATIKAPEKNDIAVISVETETSFTDDTDKNEANRQNLVLEDSRDEKQNKKGPEIPKSNEKRIKKKERLVCLDIENEERFIRAVAILEFFGYMKKQRDTGNSNFIFNHEVQDRPMNIDWSLIGNFFPEVAKYGPEKIFKQMSQISHNKTLFEFLATNFKYMYISSIKKGLLEDFKDTENINLDKCIEISKSDIDWDLSDMIGFEPKNIEDLTNKFAIVKKIPDVNKQDSLYDEYSSTIVRSETFGKYAASVPIHKVKRENSTDHSRDQISSLIKAIALTPCETHNSQAAYEALSVHDHENVSKELKKLLENDCLKSISTEAGRHVPGSQFEPTQKFCDRIRKQSIPSNVYQEFKELESDLADTSTISESVKGGHVAYVLFSLMENNLKLEGSDFSWSAEQTSKDYQTRTLDHETLFFKLQTKLLEKPQIAKYQVSQIPTICLAPNQKLRTLFEEICESIVTIIFQRPSITMDEILRLMEPTLNHLDLEEFINVLMQAGIVTEFENGYICKRLAIPIL